MNIYEFINSKDIRAHCEKLGHPFNTIESAYLIYQSQNHTLSQKHAAWLELMETMPDMVIEERLNCPRYDSIHTFLRQYMDLEDRLLADFFQDKKGYVYRFDPLYRPDYFGDNEYHGYLDGDSLYESFSGGLAAEKGKVAEYADDFLKFGVLKKKIISDFHTTPWELCIQINQDGEALKIDVRSDKGAISEMEFDLLYSFEGMWIDVPTPFQKGDIVFTNHRKLGCPANPFVLTDLCTAKDTEHDRKIYQKLLKRGDSSDMTSHGYFLSDCGDLYFECEHDYLSLEYYPGESNGNNRFLKVVQSYYKDKIHMIDFITAYRYIVSDTDLNKQKKENNFLLNELGLLK